MVMSRRQLNAFVNLFSDFPNHTRNVSGASSSSRFQLSCKVEGQMSALQTLTPMFPISRLPKKKQSGVKHISASRSVPRRHCWLMLEKRLKNEMRSRRICVKKATIKIYIC